MLAGAGLITLIIFSLMVAGLGYMAAIASFSIGWTGVALVVGFFAIISLIEAGILGMLCAPFKLIGWVLALGQKKKTTEPMSSETDSRRISYYISACFITGLIVGLLQGNLAGLS